MLWVAEDAARTSEAVSVRIVREPHLVDRVMFVGGQPGCGKSLLTSILGSFARVEIQKYNYTLEHVCALALLGKLDDSATSTMIRMLTDMDLYNLMQARETNLRPSDCSSIFRNPGPWRYLCRLFLRGDAAAVVRIRQERPILHYFIHNVLLNSPPLFRALGNRMAIVEVVRHPLYMIRQWHRYIERYGTDPRDFTIWFDYKGRAVPFFARGWEEQYLCAVPMDRVIYSISRFCDAGEQVVERFSEDERARFVRIPFERFVLDPWPYVRQLETLLGTTVTSLTRRELKRQRVPRKMIAEAIPLPIYKRYGWEPPRKGASEREELERQRHYAAQYATPDGMAALDRMSLAYEETFLRGVV
jgi:hypothetical protein